MTAELNKRDNAFFRYVKIVLREILVWNYAPLTCVPVVCLALFFTREYYLSDKNSKHDPMAIVYGVILILGICMGAVAAGHLLNGKKANAYLMLPIGRRSLFLIRLMTMLLLCISLIVATYAVFYYFTGAEYPTFYEHWAYLDVISPSVVENLAFKYSGPELWCIYGVLAATLTVSPFILGYGIGALSSTVSSFVVFSAMHALIMLAVNAISVITVEYEFFREILSPIWFIILRYGRSGVASDSLIWGWGIVGAVLMLVAVFTVPYVRAERRLRIFACRWFILFYAVIFILSALLTLLYYYYPDAMNSLVERLFGIERSIFKN